jgi:hypothetical protein
MERRFQAMNPHRGRGETEGRRRYRRGSRGGAAQDREATLDATTADRTSSGDTASDRRRETKEDMAEWAAKATWASFRNGKRK